MGAHSLFPGGSADTALSLTNPNPVAMTVSSIVGNGAITSDSAACDAAGHGVTFVNQTGAWEVAKNAALTVSLPDSVQMSLDSANECQGATFTVPVTVTASVSGQGGGGTATTTTSTTAAPAPAQFAWQPSSVVFPNAEVGTSNTTLSFDLRNVGGLSAAVETGLLGNDDFLVAGNNCTNVTLAPNQSCNIAMRFRPVTAGSRTGVMQARPAGSGGGFAIASLSGTGTAPANLQIQPSTHDYGSVATGAESSVFNFQVSNNGGTQAANVSNVISNSFVVRASNCPVNLPPGATCFIGVSFRPTQPGPHNGSLSVSYGSSATTTRTATAALAGQGF